jgi:hypothetical protein
MTRTIRQCDGGVSGCVQNVRTSIAVRRIREEEGSRIREVSNHTMNRAASDLVLGKAAGQQAYSRASRRDGLEPGWIIIITEPRYGVRSRYMS